jgi:hypothetical protein
MWNRRGTGVKRMWNGDVTDMKRNCNGPTWEQVPTSWLLPGQFRANLAVSSAGPVSRHAPTIAGLTEARRGVRECHRRTRHMNKLNFILLKMVRWSGWPLLPLILLFLLTGYIMDGRYGLSRVLDEKSALTFHRMLHLPLIVLVLAHSVPAVYLALQRWGWIKRRDEL